MDPQNDNKGKKRVSKAKLKDAANSGSASDAYGCEISKEVSSITMSEDAITKPGNIPEEDLLSSHKVEIPALRLPDPTAKYTDKLSAFGFSIQGKTHQEKGMPCQDRSEFRFLPCGVIIVAIADGVGSCALSEYGAAIATESSLDFLENEFSNLFPDCQFSISDAQAGDILRRMTQHAYDCVNAKALEMNQLLYSFQSTLTVAVYDGLTLFYSHAGDDGIIAQDIAGNYALITTRHKGEEASSVFPLQSKGTWQFGKSSNVTAFVMATDGVLDAVVRSQAENNRVYYPFIESVVYSEATNQEILNGFCKKIYDYMSSDAYKSVVGDDITLVSVANHQLLSKAVRPTFSREEWDIETAEFEEKRNAILYPHDTHELEQPSSQEKAKSVNENEATDSMVPQSDNRERDFEIKKTIVAEEPANDDCSIINI